ncbi:MAG TPA: hypothetical protein P5125_05385 [Kiritimatiellia bacterium]|nr:hypothetical protein [Kiritimatiellia bacterium]
MRSRLPLVLGGVGLALLVRAAPLASDLLLWLPCDEGGGAFTEDRSPNRLEAELSGVQWVTGSFGTALRFNGTNALAELPPVPGLNGAERFTLALWAVWEDPAPRRYPCLLSSHTWSPGGMLLFVSDQTCSFRLGRPGHRAGTPGHAWNESSVNLLSDLPQRRWTHLCVTFDRPHLTSYVDGKPVARTRWDHAVEADALRLGGWSGAVCHNGLIDDLRIYGRALTPSEITALANPSDRADAAWKPATERERAPEPPFARFRTRHAELTLNARGRVTSLRNRASGRELLVRPTPLVSARLRNGQRITARSVTRQGDALTFGFATHAGSAVVAIDAHREFFNFTLRTHSLTDATELVFCELPVRPTRYRGGMANLLSDDEDGVCLRGYDLPVEMRIAGDVLRVSAAVPPGPSGWRAGLAAGPRDTLTTSLRAMARHAGVPMSENSGPWSLEAEATRGSYLFANLAHAATDDWIEVARRGGFSTLHLHGWWQTLGHYAVRTQYYPRGLDDMRDTVERIHAAGLRAGIHTLTACIDTRDAWITPEASPHLIPFDTYTLARSVSPTDTVLYVNEPPSARHDVVFTYSGNGNAIRIGSEIIQYAAITREPPYAFRDCTRGAFKTRPAAHAAGAQADYLQQRYNAFYPQPDSPLADELADRIAHVFNTCKLDQLYFDGSEGMMSRYGIDAMRHKIMRRLEGNPLIEASCHGAHNWWFHSRLGAWDHPVWAPKRFHDDHVAVCARYRASDLLAPQMGWWAPRMATPFARGHHLDEMEYFAGKNLGLDAAMSIQGVNVNQAILPYHLERQFTLLGWYEHLRLARYFDTQTVARLIVPGAEFRLRQTRDGIWQFTPVTMRTHRVTGPDDGSAAWRVTHPHAQQPLCLRVEALYDAAPAATPPAGKSLVGTNDFAAFAVSTASAAVRLNVSEVSEETRGGNRHLRLRAENRGTTSTGAWARAVLTFPAPYRNLSGTGAFGMWVKGDGSGALLNLQVGCPREFMGGLSDHYVTLDFTGWRYVTLLTRERDTARMDEHVWPYRKAGSHALFRTNLDMAHLSQVSLYLNALPAGAHVEVTVSPVEALPVRSVDMKRPVVTVNGQGLTVPFTLASGEFAELEPDGLFTHYSERGEPLARAMCDARGRPVLRAGDNAFTYTGGRAEITVTTFGEAFGASRRRRAIDWKHLKHEYEMPRLVLASNDVTRAEWEVAVRPGEKARLGVEFSGGMASPAILAQGKTWSFPVTLQAGQRLLCRDGRNWSVLDANRATLSQGTLDTPLPRLNGGPNRVVFTCENPDRARICLVKRYE